METPAPSRHHSLSTRLFRLTIGIVLAVEVLVFVPELGHERLDWLFGRLHDAQIAMIAAGQHPHRTLPTATTDQLLAESRMDWIQLRRPGQPTITLAQPGAAMPSQTIRLRHENLFMRTVRALGVLVFDRPAATRVVAAVREPLGGQIAFVFHTHDETRDLRGFARDFVWLSLLTAGLTGLVVYIAVLLLMVRPMRRIIASIAAFRAAPERSRPPDAPPPGRAANDEMAAAGRELAAMQDELRNALWRNARLAALGNAVARVSHDLRGILAPALLTAERLQRHADPDVRRSGDVLLRAVDRATDVVRRTLDFAREGPPPLALEPVVLAPVVEEVGEAVRSSSRSFAVLNQVPADLLVHVDRNQFFRVLANLLRNAADAGARVAWVSAQAERGRAIIDLTDDGPGLPDAVRATLFLPSTRSTRHHGLGLGLAIARDLTLAHGGDITLASSGPAGTVFRLFLPLAPHGANERATAAGGNGDSHGGNAGGGTAAQQPGIAPPAKADV